MKKLNYFLLVLSLIAINFQLTLIADDGNYISKSKFIVRFKEDIRNSKSKIQAIKERLNGQIKPILDARYSLKYNPSKYLILQSKGLDINKLQATEEPILRTYILELNEEVLPKAFCKRLKNEFPEIEIIEPYYNYPIQAFTPNDTYFVKQVSFDKIKAKEAWGVWKGDSSFTIAVSDNGIHQYHEDIINSLYINKAEIPNNGIDDDGNGFIDDYNGYNFLGDQESQGWGGTYNSSVDHGTLVSGIAAATFNNNKGIAGVGGYCKLFPIKAAAGGSSILFGNESIIFAAVHHFSVLNLSWGGPREYSELEQSIINYAVANGVAIVAAGGNIGTNGGTRYDTYYPAGYEGVLAVGEVDIFDQVTEMTSCLSVPVNILAPGEGNYSTSNSGGYLSVEGGTSFASPVVAGAVALARSKHPELTPIQAIQFVRQCSDDITKENSNFGDIKLMPGRLNLLKVVTIDPYSIPGLIPISYLWSNSANSNFNRFSVGDTVFLQIKIKNVLGNATNLNFTMLSAYDPSSSVEIIKNDAMINFLNTSDETIIGPFKILITKQNTNRIIFRMNITGDNNFNDMFKFDFIPTTSFATFETDKIAFSLSDKGDFGYVEIGNKKEGAGFLIKGISNQLYGNSGIIISENDKKVVSIFDDPFKTIKKFINPDFTEGIITDDYAGTTDKIGLEITQKVSFPHPNVAQIDLITKNKSENTLTNLSIGYYYDWDIDEDADSNVAVLYDEINKADIKSQFNSIGAELIYKPNTNIFVGCVAYSKETNTKAQIAGLDYDFTESFTKAKQIDVLKSGTSLQNDKIYDRSVFTGIRFEGDFPPQTEKKMSVLIGGNTDRNELANNIITALKTNSVDESPINSKFQVIAEPFDGLLKIRNNNEDERIINIELFDLFGNQISYQNVTGSNYSTNPVILSLSNVNSQIIILRISTSLHKVTEKIVWLK